MLTCGSPFPMVFITTYWANDPAVLIKIKGMRRKRELETCVKRWRDETTEE